MDERSAEPDAHQSARFEGDKGTVDDPEALRVDQEVEDGLGLPGDLDLVSDLHLSHPVQRAGGAAATVALIAREAHHDTARGGTVGPMPGHWRFQVPVADDCVTPCDRNRR